MRRALIFACAITASAAEYNSNEVLQRGIEKVLQSAKRIPNYTCVETVTRDYFEPKALSLPRSCSVLLEQREHPTPDLVLQPYSRDRLRLDVTMSSRGEIFSWAGARHFEDAGVDSVVRAGPIATGSFGGFLITVFETDVKKFTFERVIPTPDATLLEYSFQVPQPDSHYHVKYDANSWIFVPYSGTFQLNAETADLVSLRISTGDVPPVIQFCRTSTTLDFHRIQLGGGQFFLPKLARQRFVYPSVSEIENTTSLAKCREFSGESRLTFSPPETPRAAGKPILTGEPSLPPGIRLTMHLTAPISADTAAAGDPFSGKLSDDARSDEGKTVAPSGSRVEGRLLRVQTFARPPETVFALKLEAIWVRRVRFSVSAVRDWNYIIAQQRRRGKGVEIAVPLRGEEDAGIFRFPGEHGAIPAGNRSDWKTIRIRTAGEVRSGG